MKEGLKQRYGLLIACCLVSLAVLACADASRTEYLPDETPPAAPVSVTGTALELGPLVFPTVFVEEVPEYESGTGEEGFVRQHITTRDGRSASFWLKAPEDYNTHKDQAWPLVVHNNIFATLEWEYRDRNDLFILLCDEPLVTDGPHDSEVLVAETILDTLCRFNIDRTRMVVGGFSSGSSGAFQFASFFCTYTGIPFSVITRNAGKMFDESKLDFDVLSRSFVWFHTGYREYDELQGLESENRLWPLLKARDHFAAVRAAHEKRGARVTLRHERHASADWVAHARERGEDVSSVLIRLKNFYDTPLFAEVDILYADGLEVARKSEYHVDAHDTWSCFVLDYDDFVLSK